MQNGQHINKTTLLKIQASIDCLGSD